MGITKKIAVLCNYTLLPKRVGGMDYFFWMFDQQCKDNNVEIEWFFPNSASHGEYKNLTILASNSENVELFFTDYLIRNKPKYDVVFTHFVEVCAPIFKTIKQKSNAKIIVVDHNPRPIEGYSFKKKVVKRIKGLLFSRYIDVFIGVSEYSKNQLIEEFGSQISKKSTVIFNGLSVEKFIKRSTHSFNGKFLVASHLRKDKGIQDLVVAVANLVKKQPYDFVIDVYGSGYYEDFLKTMVVEHKVEHYFNFMGNVTHLHELYQHYDYLIHPSHGETFCYSVVEALFCNLPVITTKNEGNVLRLIHDAKNGFLFDVQNVLQLECILKNILSNQIQLNNSLFSNPKLEDLTLENMVAHYYQLIS